MNYQNPYRIEDFNCSIVEWDIRSANVSISREYGLLSESTINKIASQHKSKRERSIGLIMRKNKEFSKALESKFDEVMQIFIEQNNLDVDWDILSIRKDAAFVINKEIKNPIVGKHIEFRPKGVYSHHVYLKPPKAQALDIYVGNTIDIKGIGDELLPLHENGMINFIKEICRCMGMDDEKKSLNELFADFVLAYKCRELPYDYYREFNVNSKFKVNLYGNEVMLDYIDSDDLLESVDISYNYEKIILPLIRLLR